MTTNLVNRRAHQLPLDSREWYFDPDAFRALFGAEVVDWMVAHSPPAPGGEGLRVEGASRASAAALPMPPAADLPVVVATRMSLSFPVLISAVPLYAIDFDRPDGARPRPERCWFSDGGIPATSPSTSSTARSALADVRDQPAPVRPRQARRRRRGAERLDPDATSQGIDDWWYRIRSATGGCSTASSPSSARSSGRCRTGSTRPRCGCPATATGSCTSASTRRRGRDEPDDAAGADRGLTERGRAAAERLREAYRHPTRSDR